MPRIISIVVSLWIAVMPVSANRTGPSLASLMPNANFCFLLDFEAGRYVVKKFFRVAVTLGAPIAMMFSRASSAVLNGCEPTNLVVFENRSKDWVAF